MKTKICTSCGEDKPLTDYYRSKKSLDGYYTQCKKCQAVKAKSGKTMGRKRVTLTKENLQFIVDNWSKMSLEEIADSLNLRVTSLKFYTQAMRSFGIDLPHKKRMTNRIIIMNFAEEWLKNNKKKEK